jgi:hypothetical protein
MLHTLLLTTFTVLAAPSAGVEARATMSDDRFAGDTAQGRSYGTTLRLEALGTPSEEFQDRVPGGILRFGAAVGLIATTPSDITRTDIDRTDRPHSGYTYAGFIVEFSDGAKNRLRAELDYGAVGAWSGAGAFHRAWSRVAGGSQPRGWNHQIRNELHFHLVADWDRELVRALPTRWGHLVDVQTHARLEMAEWAVAGTAGATVRLGLLQRPFLGVPDVRADRRRSEVQVYAYARGDASAVLRRTTVDGSIFDRPDDASRSPHRSDSRTFVPRGEVGVVIQPVRNVDIGFALQHVGPEVNDPGAKGHTVGRVSLGVRF